ncbi:MAG: hypothetical protein AB7I41_22770 [Candidatus Sericytochromatia bacterium]
MMTRIWIYGFVPFRRYRKNITQELLLRLPARAGLITQVLPVVFESEQFLGPVEALKPDYILGLGQCPRGRLLRLERRAYNQMVDRSQNCEQQIDASQPDWISLKWQLPLRSDCRISLDAGRYVCNYSMFVLAQYAQQEGIPTAFVHVPRTYSIYRGLAWLECVLGDLGLNAVPPCAPKSDQSGLPELD